MTLTQTQKTTLETGMKFYKSNVCSYFLNRKSGLEDTTSLNTAMRLPVSLTILLLTSSSIALTSSAALGVSELVGRTSNREDVCTIT